MSNKNNNNNEPQFIKEEVDLPKSYILLSSNGEELELDDGNKRNFAVLKVTNESVWLISSKNEYGKVSFMSVHKKITQDKKYKVVKMAIAEPAFINKLYEFKKVEETQNQTKNDSVAIAFFELMLSDALINNISDIHILVRQGSGIIKMRKHGEMMRWGEPLSYDDAFNLCAVMYNVLAENKQTNFDMREYQPAAINYKIKDNEVKLRYQSLPVYPDGFDVILRVLPIGKDEEFTPLTKLGYTEQQVKDLIDAASRPVGSIIVAGVTGSGKSTTLKNLLMFVNSYSEYKLKIYTIEDPPEYKIPHVSQIPVIRPKDKDGSLSKISPFEAPITACMRADPDIIMIGEVRDGITGNLSKKAIQSGHQVLTTVHASSAAGIIDRFLDFDVSRSVLGSPDFLTALVYQKLLPTVCPHCSKTLIEHLNDSDITQKEVEVYKRLGKLIDIKKYPKIRVRSSSGCEKCDFMGIKGRTVCAEIIKMNLELMQFIADGKTIEFLRAWRAMSDEKIDSENMTGKTCMEHAVQKMLKGLVDPSDVEESFKPLDELFLDKKEMNQENMINNEQKEELEKLEEKIISNKGNIWDDF